MKDATKCGIAVGSKKVEHKEITVEEETQLWKKGLLGTATAMTLLHTVYFYNGKIFGLRAGEHRLLRKCNIIIDENFIIFYESLSKTFHGGLKNLTKKTALCETQVPRNWRNAFTLFDVYVYVVFEQSVDSCKVSH